MQEVIAFLLRHGYAVLVGAVFLEQIGLPFPAVPVMLAVGALAGDGTFSFALALLLATAMPPPSSQICLGIGWAARAA